MKTESNAARLKAIMEETDRTWDFTPFINILADDVVFKATVPEGTPISGEFKGKDAVTEYFMKILPDTAVFKQQVPMDFIDDGDRVIILGDDAYTLIKNNRTYRSSYAMIVKFSNGLVDDILIIQDLSGFYDAYKSK